MCRRRIRGGGFDGSEVTRAEDQQGRSGTSEFDPESAHDILDGHSRGSGNARRENHCIVCVSAHPIDDEAVVFVDADHLDRVAGRWLLVGTQRFEFAKCVCRNREFAFALAGIVRKQRTCNCGPEVTNDARPNGYDILSGQVVSMCNEVSHVLDVEKGLGAVVLPETVLH